MKRRWLRFSVRSLLVLVTLCGLILGTYTIFIRSHIQAYHREQATIVELNDLDGVISVIRRPGGPAWLQWWKNGAYSNRVVELSIGSQALSKEYFAKVSRFQHLESITIRNGNAFSDEALLQLADIPTLRSLDLLHTHVHDAAAGSLHRLNLRKLQLVTNRFGANEANWIKDLDELKQLVLAAPVADADLATLASLPNLEELTIHSSAVTDAGLIHIARFQSLRSLVLHCPVSDSGMEHLIPLAKLERLECNPNPKQANLVSKLMMPVRAKYLETLLVDAVDVMSKLTGLAMRIDDAALQAAGLTASDVRLTVDENGDLRQAFDAMLAPHGLACVGESGGLLITTTEEAARRRPGTTRLLEANPKLEAYVPW